LFIGRLTGAAENTGIPRVAARSGDDARKLCAKGVAVRPKHAHWPVAISELFHAIQRVERAARIVRSLSTAPGWAHQTAAPVPESYKFGPLVGSKTELSRWIWCTRRLRRIERENALGRDVWIRRIDRCTFECWFCEERLWLAAMERKSQQ
jgi:hypothetical protein